MQPATATPEPFKWGLFNHNPALSMHATDRNAPVFATCTCGWASPEVPRHRAAEAMEAEQGHLRDVDTAIQRWRTEDAAKRETLPQQVARLYPDGGPAGLVPIRLVPVEVFGADCQCHEDQLLTDDGPECGDFSYGICDAVSAYSDCNRAVGRIYRRDEDESRRAVGDTVLVWVAPEQAALFDVVFGEP